MRAVILVTESNVWNNGFMKDKSQSEALQIQIKVCYLICGVCWLNTSLTAPKSTANVLNIIKSRCTRWKPPVFPEVLLRKATVLESAASWPKMISSTESVRQIHFLTESSQIRHSLTEPQDH